MLLNIMLLVLLLYCVEAYVVMFKRIIGSDCFGLNKFKTRPLCVTPKYLNEALLSQNHPQAEMSLVRGVTMGERSSQL